MLIVDYMAWLISDCFQSVEDHHCQGDEPDEEQSCPTSVVDDVTRIHSERSYRLVMTTKV